MQGMEPLFIPCTPKGCIELLIQSGVEIMGKKAVVIGRSNIVGLPTSLLLQVLSYFFCLSFPSVSCHNYVVIKSLWLNISNYSIPGQRHHATVTVLHAFTKNPEKIACEADILVTAAGVPNLVRGSWLKPGAVIVDVGTNPVEVTLYFLNNISFYLISTLYYHLRWFEITASLFTCDRSLTK